MMKNSRCRLFLKVSSSSCLLQQVVFVMCVLATRLLFLSLTVFCERAGGKPCVRAFGERNFCAVCYRTLNCAVRIRQSAFLPPRTSKFRVFNFNFLESQHTDFLESYVSGSAKCQLHCDTSQTSAIFERVELYHF